MAIVSVTETFTNRVGERNDKRERNYTRTFNVLTTSRSTTEPEVLLAAGVPRVFNPYVTSLGAVDLGSWCRSVRARVDTQDPYLWRVEAQYSSRIERQDLNGVENPLLRPADISWDTVGVSRPAWMDVSGEPIFNSSRERFDPPLEVEENRLVLTITRNQATYDALFYLGYKNAVNLDPFFGFQPGRAKCEKIKGTRAFENGLLYWKVDFVFHFRVQLDENDDLADPAKSDRAWSHRVLDQGYMVLDSGGKQAVATDALGRPVSAPVLLNGSGAKLGVGASPVFLTFYLYPSKSFVPLGLA